MHLTLVFFEEWPAILQLNFVLSILFLSISLGLLGLLFYLRIFKIGQNKRKIILEEHLVDFINHYLFDEEFNTPEQIFLLKTDLLKTDFDKKIAIEQILLFSENLKGESGEAIKKLFLSLDLYDFTLRDLKSDTWHKKARAIYIFSQLSIEIPVDLIEPLINAKKDEVRQQALLYFVNVNHNNPLNFLSKIKLPLTLWQQIYLENGLKTLHMDQIPDFSIWLDHPLRSVTEFCIKMIAEYNQFENIPMLEEMVHHKEESVRKEAVRSLKKLGQNEIIPYLVSIFPKETTDIKKEILRIIKELGTYDQFRSLSTFVDREHTNIRIDYYKTGRYFKPDLEQQVLKRELNLLKENYAVPHVA